MLSAAMLLSAALFSAGVCMVLFKKHFILMLIGVELIFNAANVNLIVFGRYFPHIKGQMFALFVIAVAACEAAVALAVIIYTYRKLNTADPNHWTALKG